MATSSNSSSRDAGDARRRSRRVVNQSNHPQRGVPSYASFRKPWNQHYVDIGHGRFQKCTRRVLQASTTDLRNLKVSGRKSDLVNRLWRFLAPGEVMEEVEEDTVDTDFDENTARYI